VVQPTTSVMKATNWTARTTYLETIIDISQHLSESLEFSPLLYERDDTKESAPLYVPLKETQDELQGPTRKSPERTVLTFDAKRTWPSLPTFPLQGLVDGDHMRQQIPPQRFVQALGNGGL